MLPIDTAIARKKRGLAAKIVCMVDRDVFQKDPVFISKNGPSQTLRMQKALSLDRQDLWVQKNRCDRFILVYPVLRKSDYEFARPYRRLQCVHNAEHLLPLRFPNSYSNRSAVRFDHDRP